MDFRVSLPWSSPGNGVEMMGEFWECCCSLCPGKGNHLPLPSPGWASVFPARTKKGCKNCRISGFNGIFLRVFGLVFFFLVGGFFCFVLSFLFGLFPLKEGWRHKLNTLKIEILGRASKKGKIPAVKRGKKPQGAGKCSDKS